MKRPYFQRPHSTPLKSGDSKSDRSNQSHPLSFAINCHCRYNPKTPHPNPDLLHHSTKRDTGKQIDTDPPNRSRLKIHGEQHSKSSTASSRYERQTDRADHTDADDTNADMRYDNATPQSDRCEYDSVDLLMLGLWLWQGYSDVSDVYRTWYSECLCLLVRILLLRSLLFLALRSHRRNSIHYKLVPFLIIK